MQTGELAGSIVPLIGSVWGSMPTYMQGLLVLLGLTRTAEGVVGLLSRRTSSARRLSAAAFDGLDPDLSGDESFDPSEALAKKRAPIEVGIVEIGTTSRVVRWDGISYRVDGVREAVPVPVLAQLMSRYPGRLYSAVNPRQPGVLTELPPGISSLLPACPEDGESMRLWPSHEAAGTWLARCVKNEIHSRHLTREEEGLLADLTGLRLRAGVLHTPEGARDILWDGKVYTIPGITGVLPAEQLAALASRPQVRLFGPHAEASQKM